MEQSRATMRMALRIRKMKSRHTLREICLKLGILKANGEPDTALAWQIGYNDFEPTRQATRARIGLPTICSACHRKVRIPSRRAARVINQAEKYWNSMKPEKRRQWKDFIYHAELEAAFKLERPQPHLQKGAKE